MARYFRRALWTFAVCLAAPALPARSAEPRAYRTPQQLREACKSLFKPARPVSVPKAPSGMVDDRECLFVVDYLSSSDEAMRTTAVDILAKLCYGGRAIRASAFDPYLAPERPADVRLIALSFSLANDLAQEEQRVPNQVTVTWEQKRAKWSEAINSLIEEPVVPRNFGLLARTMERRSYPARVELIKPENRRMMLRRCLHSLSRVPADVDRGLIAKLLKRFPLDLLVEIVTDWYGVEPDPRARAAVVSHLWFLASGDDRVLAKFRPVLRLAARDWDRGTAETAKELLTP